MTNREAFNNFLRAAVESQLDYYKAMSNDELINATVEHPNMKIQEIIAPAISSFKMHIKPGKVGTKDDVIEWLGQEYTVETESEKQKYEQWLEMDKPKLKRCPFCGHMKPMFIRGLDGTVAAIHCWNCNSYIKFTRAKTIEEYADAYNRRISEQG